MYSIVLLMSLTGQADAPVMFGCRRRRCDSCYAPSQCYAPPQCYMPSYPPPCGVITQTPASGGKDDKGKDDKGAKTGDVKMSKEVEEILRTDPEIKTVYEGLKTTKEKQEFVDKLQKELDKKKKDKQTSREPAPATLTVNLPANAVLFFDDHRTRSTSGERTFVTPVLQPGFTYTYTLTVQTNEGGQVQTSTRKVEVSAGEQAKVTFGSPAIAVGAR